MVFGFWVRSDLGAALGRLSCRDLVLLDCSADFELSSPRSGDLEGLRERFCPLWLDPLFGRPDGDRVASVAFSVLPVLLSLAVLSRLRRVNMYTKSPEHMHDRKTKIDMKIKLPGRNLKVISATKALQNNPTPMRPKTSNSFLFIRLLLQA